MVREYLEQNVYEALMDRFKLLFEEFDNIYVSFSGGKDSGLLLNLVLDYRNKYYPQKSIGVFHQDFEAQYTVTTEYIERTFEKIKDQVEPYWVCLPMATRTALSSYEMDLMSNIVKELHELGRSDAWISKHLGMDKDEILRLKQITGLAALFKDVKFGKAWIPTEEEEQ